MFFSSEFLQQIQLLPDELSKQSFFISQNVFNPDVVDQLSNSFEQRKENLKTAHIGPLTNVQKNTEVRNDQISWIDQNEKDFTPLFHLIELLTKEVKRTLFLPLRRYELQMALYPKDHFYKLHVDQHRDFPHRLLTFVYYLNDWTPDCGGELRLISKIDQKSLKPIFQSQSSHTHDSLSPRSEVIIAPQKNHMVLFFSDLEHEVLVTHKERKSYTAWLRDDIL